MTPNRPYLIRALREWIMDNDMTPHLLIDANAEGVTAPQQYVNDGKIILNTSPSAINDLEMGNQWIMFNARFSGVLFQIELPIHSVLAVYAKENGQGMIFPDEPEEELLEGDNISAKEDNGTTVEDKKKNKGKPHLKVIK